MTGAPAGLEPPRSRLCEFLRDREAEIIADWTQRMRAMSQARDLSDSAIVDHLPKILELIADFVESVHNGKPVSFGTLPKAHAVDRLARGFDLDNIVTEYGLLRRTVLDLWEARIGPTIDLGELRNFDTALDELLRQATVRYAEARDKLLKAVDRISESALGTADLETFLKDLLRATLESTESVDTAVVLLREGDTLRVRAAVGLEEGIDETFPITTSGGIAGHVATERGPIFIQDAASDPRVTSPAIRGKGVRALYGVPLMRDDKVIGVAHIGSLTASEFSEEDKLLFRTMASRATSIVIKAQLLAELRRTESAHRFLAEASRQFAQSLDYEATLKRIARLAVPTIADWCVVDLIQNGALQRVSVSHADPDKEKLAYELEERYPQDPNAATGIPHVLRTGRPELIAEITDAEMASTATDSQHLEILRGLGLKSYIIVPILSRDQVLGTIAFVTAESKRRYSEDDLRIAEDLAGRAATAIENARLYAEAQNAVQLREQVLAIVSHDLRNQLGVISMGTNLLAMKVSTLKDGADVAKPVETIQRTASSMQHLLGDLLDMASIQAGRLSFEPQRVGLKSVLVESYDSHQLIARDKGVRLHSETAVDDVDVICDRDRVLQVLGNLLGNAIKFCDAGDTVTLRAELRAKDVLIAVGDTGPGISREDLPTSVEAYSTIERPGKGGGTGLGLYITKGIVERHGGRIWVDSEAGTGSTFFFTLPRA